MIPISSAKLNSKLATRAILKEGRSNKRSCICLMAGMVVGVCLAGIIFYSSLPNEKYRINSKNLLKIIKLDVPQNVSNNSTSMSINITKKPEDFSVVPT
ncbi:hypothetical protein KR084_008663, partial [Drosophila pseudotakahashii]